MCIGDAKRPKEENFEIETFYATICVIDNDLNIVFLMSWKKVLKNFKMLH